MKVLSAAYEYFYFSFYFFSRSKNCKGVFCCD